MPKYEPLSSMSGAEALVSLLAFLQDKKAVEQRLRELHVLHAEINTAIAKLGKAEEIDGLHATALEHRQQAAAEQRRAREKAADTIREAVNARDAAVQEAATARRGIAVAREVLDKDRAAWLAEEGQRKEAIRLLKVEAQQDLVAAEAQRQATAALQAEWTAKVEKLKAAGVILGVPA